MGTLGRLSAAEARIAALEAALAGAAQERDQALLRAGRLARAGRRVSAVGRAA